MVTLKKSLPYYFWHFPGKLIAKDISVGFVDISDAIVWSIATFGFIRLYWAQL